MGHNKLNMGHILILVIIFSTFLGVFFYNPTYTIPKTNYLGLAELGLIPTTNQCSHSQDAYTSTGIVARTNQGDFAILKSKFGDEYCPLKI